PPSGAARRLPATGSGIATGVSGFRPWPKLSDQLSINCGEEGALVLVSVVSSFQVPFMPVGLLSCASRNSLRVSLFSGRKSPMYGDVLALVPDVVESKMSRTAVSVKMVPTT